MEPAGLLVTRVDTSSDYSFTPSITNLLLGLLILVLLGLLLAGVLYILRRRQAANAELLPTHQKNPSHRRLTITATPYTGKTDPLHVSDEKRNLIENSFGPPDSPLPEIRITFPDEEDQSGKKKNGRVVIVRMGDSGSIGMEPVSQDCLPPYHSNEYHSNEMERFQSLDLERMGGLKENIQPRRWS